MWTGFHFLWGGSNKAMSESELVAGTTIAERNAADAVCCVSVSISDGRSMEWPWS